MVAVIRAIYDCRFRQQLLHYEDSILSYLYPGLSFMPNSVTETGGIAEHGRNSPADRKRNCYRDGEMRDKPDQPGDAALTGKNGIEVDMLSGKQVTLKAEEYIFIQCGMSAAALLPEEIHLKGTRVQMDSSLNGKEETVFSDEAPETLKELYYNEKWGSPLQLFMPDGTVIGRVKGLEGNAALRKYFEENVLGTGEYVNYLDSETLAPYYEDGTLDPAERENYENSLYLKWLSATYGKTRLEKAGDWLMTKEGRHAALDGIGIFLDPADLVNAVLYLSEGELGDAALSGVSMIPMLGDLFGKGRKGTKYLLKAADLTKLNRNRKVVKVLENIDIFIKARKADMGEPQKWIRKSLDNLAHGGDEVIELVTPDGIKIRISGDLRANINLMDETGDMLQDTVRLGEKAGDGGTGNQWWEAKSGGYWEMLESNPNKLAKFKSDMGDRLRIATENGATYELFSNTPIPASIKRWLDKKGIAYTELLD